MADAVPPNAFRLPLEVADDQVDLQGHVANHEIVRMFVALATAHSAALGWDLDAYRALGAWWVVRRHEIDYLAPARAGDRLVGHTWPSAVHKARAERTSVLVRPADGRAIARAKNVWTLIDIETGRPRRIPRVLIETFDPSRWEA